MLDKAFELFVEYAENIERDTRGVRTPSLQIYNDKSGCIRDNRAPYTYLSFTDIEDLITQLEQQKTK
jgi:hypothetical protein